MTDPATGPCGADPAPAERCLHEVWAELTARGFIIEEPEPGIYSQCYFKELPDDPWCEMDLLLTRALAWIYVPLREGFTAIRAARLVLALLTGTRRPVPDMPPAPDPGLAIKDVAGRLLADCGMTTWRVGIEYSPGEIAQEIVVANPGCPDRGHARIAAAGTIRWECRFADPGRIAPGLGSRDVARAIDAALAMAEDQPR